MNILTVIVFLILFGSAIHFGNTRFALYNPLNYTLEGIAFSESTTLSYWKPKCPSGTLALGDVLLVNPTSPPNLSHYYCAANLNRSSTLISAAKNFLFQLQQGNINLYRGTNESNTSITAGLIAKSNEGGQGTGSSTNYAAFFIPCLEPCQQSAIASVHWVQFNGVDYTMLIFDVLSHINIGASAYLFIANITANLNQPLCLKSECLCGNCVNGTCDLNGNCVCFSGWQGPSCDQDIDECSEGIAQCDPLVECINTPGSYFCGPCPSGYNDTSGGLGYRCVDINECQLNSSICVGNVNGSNCFNLPGSYQCNNCSNGTYQFSNGTCGVLNCGNGILDPGEECDGGLYCLSNCTCASNAEPINSVNCRLLCGNGILNPGEECDSGIGCDNSTCRCSAGWSPQNPPALNCSEASAIDPCNSFSGDCTTCLAVDCLFCSSTGTCLKNRVSSDCETSCPGNGTNETNNNNSPSPVTTEDLTLITSLLGSISGALLLTGLVLFLVFFIRRKRKQKKEKEERLLSRGRSLNRSTSLSGNKGVSKYGIARSELKPVETFEWEPPADSKAVLLNKLPVGLSKEEIDFGIGSNQFKVGQEYTDSFTFLTEESKIKDEVKVIFHPPKNPKYTIEFIPSEVVLKKGKNVQVDVTLTVNMTTEIEFAVGIEFPNEKVHSFMPFKVVSELSSFIDFDELVFDKKPVGDGAFGTVYRGQYRGQDVAVKVLKIQDLPEPMLDEFDREIDLMTKLRHKNIVQFVGASKVPGKFAIVTEFIEEGSVQNLLRKGPVDYLLKLRIAADAARAIAFLHSNKILHRDLKPDNLLLVSKSLDAPVIVKLSDFGTSRAVSEKASQAYTMGVGTPIYMAPEILAKKQYDLKADVYSFGVILWVLYTQKEPYSSMEHSWEVAKFVIDGNRETIPKDCPEDYKNLIERCWHADPSQRPTMQEVCDILEQMIKNFKSK